MSDNQEQSEQSTDKTSATVANPADDNADARERSRKRWRFGLMVLAPVIIIAAGIYFYLSGGRYEETDDAYVRSAMTMVSSNVSGKVSAIAVHENQVVHAGDLLFRIDDAPFQIAVQEAQAQLATSRMQVQALKAAYHQRLADVSSAEATATYRQSEYERQNGLLASGISSRAQVEQLRSAAEAAHQQVVAAEQQAAAALANIGGDANQSVDKHPSVQAARAALDKAELNLSYTRIVAPTEGVVTKVEQLQVGNYINASAPAFALVSNSDVWVEANFKESQLTHMRAGQEVTITIDSFPGTEFRGHVASLSPGTGSTFSVLPAENATGNWVKVVQRLPVRLAFDDASAKNALHSGLSATVKVDTEHQRTLFGKSATTVLGTK